MTPGKATDLANRLLYLLPLAGLGLAVANVWQPYSYWYDELYSVTESLQDPTGMLDLLLADVHPPLYQLLLWFWIRLFGDSEPATRAMSLMFAISALATLAYWTRRQSHGLRIGALVFFTTVELFSYYAQETRSYAMLLFLATLLTVVFLDYRGDRRHFLTLLGIGLLLSLTHYFGLLIAGVAFSWLFFTSLGQPKRLALLLLVGALALVWPIIQAHYGDIMNKTGGHFWIKVDGPLDTLRIAFKLLDGISKALLVMLVLILSIRQVRAGWAAHKENLSRLGFLVCGTLLAAVLIDLHTPVSTKRNFIILLPAFAVLFGVAVDLLSRHHVTRIAALLLLLVVGYGNLNSAYKWMHRKWAPEQNWQAAAAHLARHATPDMAIYFLPYKDRPKASRANQLANRYYLSRLLGRPYEPRPINIADIPTLAKPFAILFGSFQAGMIEQRIAASRGSGLVSIYYPPQHHGESTGVIYSLPSPLPP